MPEKTRQLAVFLATGERMEFPEANAWALTGPDDRDLELLDRDWEARETRRSVAYFAAGGWLGLTFADLDEKNAAAKAMGFRAPRS